MVKVPEGWARTTTNDGVTFSDKLNTVSVSVVKMPTAPTAEWVRTVLVPSLAASISKFHYLGQVQVTRSVGSGLLVSYLQDSAVDPVTNKVVRDAVERYLFWRNGRLATLVLVGPQGSDNVDPWRRVTDSFAWTR